MHSELLLNTYKMEYEYTLTETLHKGQPAEVHDNNACFLLWLVQCSP